LGIDASEFEEPKIHFDRLSEGATDQDLEELHNLLFDPATVGAIQPSSFLKVGIQNFEISQATPCFDGTATNVSDYDSAKNPHWKESRRNPL
jgi:hypothetical protein